jgi:hypothetical protein
MSKDAKMRAQAAAALLLYSLSLGGCATSTTGSSPMDARAESQARPTTSAYPAVEDLPPQREKPAMTAAERLKLQKELIGARDRQAPGAKANQAPRAKTKAGAASLQPRSDNSQAAPPMPGG